MNWQKITNTLITILVTACAVFAFFAGENIETISMQNPETIGSDSLISFKITGKIDPKSLQESFSISPKTEFSVDVSANLVSVIPKTSLIPGITYKIKFKGKVMGTLDKIQELEKEFSVSARRPRIAAMELFDDGSTGLTIFDFSGERVGTFGNNLGNLISFAFSPNADFAVCSFTKQPLPPQKTGEDFSPETDVYLINVIDNTSRMLNLPKGFCYKNFAWSPKNRAIMAVQAKGKSNRIVVFDTNGNYNPLFEEESFVLENNTPLLFSKDSTILGWLDISKKSFVTLNLANYKITTHRLGHHASRVSLAPSGDFLLSEDISAGLLHGVFIGDSSNNTGKPIIGVSGKAGVHPYISTDGTHVVWVSGNHLIVKNLVDFEELEYDLGEIPRFPIISADAMGIIYTAQDDRAWLFDTQSRESKILCRLFSNEFGTALVFVP